jgi:hypothetical protein
MTANNNNNNNRSSKAEEEDKIPASSSSSSSSSSSLRPSPSLLEILEDMLRNRIMQKKQDIHKTQSSIADTERLWTEIETLRWILSQSLSISSSSKRRQLGHE